MKYTVTRRVPRTNDTLTFTVAGNSPGEAARSADELAWAVASHRRLLSKRAPKPEKWALAATTREGQK